MTTAVPKKPRVRRTKMDKEYAESVAAPKKSILEPMPERKTKLDLEINALIQYLTSH